MNISNIPGLRLLTKQYGVVECNPSVRTIFYKFDGVKHKFTLSFPYLVFCFRYCTVFGKSVSIQHVVLGARKTPLKNIFNYLSSPFLPNVSDKLALCLGDTHSICCQDLEEGILRLFAIFWGSTFDTSFDRYRHYTDGLRLKDWAKKTKQNLDFWKQLPVQYPIPGAKYRLMNYLGETIRPNFKQRIWDIKSEMIFTDLELHHANLNENIADCYSET